jgi:predicted TPR repeat methyltransferase
MYEIKDVYDGLTLADLRYLHFRRKSFDVIVCVQVLEYLKRFDGLKLV